MSVQNITTLKNSFQTGDHPTQTDYWNWLDTMFYGTQSSLQQILQGGNTASRAICLSSDGSAYSVYGYNGVSTIFTSNGYAYKSCMNGRDGFFNCYSNSSYYTRSNMTRSSIYTQYKNCYTNALRQGTINQSNIEVTYHSPYSGPYYRTSISPQNMSFRRQSGNLILSSLGTSSTHNQYFQDASGTIALLSDIGTFSGSGVNFSGTTSNGVLTYLTGSTVSVQSSMTYDGSTLNLGASSSTGVIINVQGSSGQLFTVSDGLTGSLFGVSDISGIPLFTVNSNGAVYPSSFNSSNIYATQSLISIDKTSGKSAFIDYVVDNTTGFRSGTILSVWNGTNVVSNDTSVSIGTTTGITLSATISGTYFKVYANVTSGTWSVKMGIRVL